MLASSRGISPATFAAGVIPMISKTLRTGAGVLVLTLATACTTIGAGVGTTREDNLPVNFSWSSDNAVSGTMTAKLADGESFTGKFFQVTSETRVDRLAPLWVGWRHHRDWPFWGMDTGPDFVKHYSGRVVANLQDTNGARMRCSFRLVEPSSGMTGGGAGRCQTPAGETVDATFPAA
jgi:hypothetical protein